MPDGAERSETAATRRRARRCDRDEPRAEHGERAEREEEHAGDDHRRDRREAPHVAPDRLAGQHREDGRTRALQHRARRAGLVARGGEGVLDQREVRLLRVEIEARGRGLHEEERGPPVAGRPDAEMRRRPRLAFSPASTRRNSRWDRPADSAGRAPAGEASASGRARARGEPRDQNGPARRRAEM
jgi:hypothetical protein